MYPTFAIANTKVIMFWDATPCRLFYRYRYRRFGKDLLLSTSEQNIFFRLYQIQVRSNCSETPVAYKTTRSCSVRISGTISAILTEVVMALLSLFKQIASNTSSRPQPLPYPLLVTAHSATERLAA
jgi:hypothetical protein